MDKMTTLDKATKNNNINNIGKTAKNNPKKSAKLFKSQQRVNFYGTITFTTLHHELHSILTYSNPLGEQTEDTDLIKPDF